MNETLKWILGIVAFIVITIIIWNKTAYRDINELKINAPAFIEERGFKITSYDGYCGGWIHGGTVGYHARDKEGYLYYMDIKEWRGEYHLYNLMCLNALKVSENGN
jgi:hypothetical protein